VRTLLLRHGTILLRSRKWVPLLLAHPSVKPYINGLQSVLSRRAPGMILLQPATALLPSTPSPAYARANGGSTFVILSTPHFYSHRDRTVRGLAAPGRLAAGPVSKPARAPAHNPVLLSFLPNVHDRRCSFSRSIILTSLSTKYASPRTHRTKLHHNACCAYAARPHMREIGR